jgi:large subunit ribosomal protein L4
MNKKERRKALCSVLSSKFANKNLVVIDKIDFSEIKTKNMLDLFNKFTFDKKVLLAIPAKNEIIEKSTANIPFVKSVLVNYLNIKDLLKYETLFILKESLDNLGTLTK